MKISPARVPPELAAERGGAGMRLIKKWPIILIILVASGLLVSVAGCFKSPGDPRYFKADKQYGTTRGLFRDRWWNFYERGESFLDGAFYQEAATDFRKAISLRSEDQRRARTYGLHFTDYFPHRELGVALYHSKQYGEALKELELSLRMVETAKAKFYLNKAREALLEEQKVMAKEPSIEISSPKEGEITSNLVAEITGAASDDFYVSSIRVNQRPLFIELASKHIPFKRKVLLKRGSNEIEVTATNLAGKSATKRLTILVDREGPVINLEQPIEEAAVEKAELEIKGTVSDQSGVSSFQIDGRDVPVPKAQVASFSHIVKLKEGPNKLTMVAKDAAGNETLGELNIALGAKAKRETIKAARWRPGGMVRLASSSQQFSDVGFIYAAAAADTFPPKISIKGLTSGMTFYQEDLFIDGSVADAGGVASLAINREPIALGEGAKVYFNYMARLAEGENNIVIEAADKAGNKAESSFKVIRKIQNIRKVGSRMAVALLPLQGKGEGSGLADIINDLIEQALFERGRFNLVSRQNQAFEAALRELKLSQTGLVEKSSAVKVGRIVAAEGILSGSIMEKENSLEIIAQLINTETSEIMTIQDVFDTDKSLDNVRFLLSGLAMKFENSFPLVEGLVLKVEGKDLFIDLGIDSKIRKEMKFIIYREGEKIKHPVTGKLLEGEPKELGLARVDKVLKDMTKAVLLASTDEGADIKQLDKVITR